MDQCVSPNGKQNKKLELTGFVRSLNGLSHTNSVKSTLKFPDGTIVTIPTDRVNNDTWGDTINQLGLGVKGVSVTSITDELSMLYHLNFPQLENQIGQVGTLNIEMKVTYPKLEEDDNVISRSAHNLAKMGFTFFDKTDPINYSMQVIMKPADYKKSHWHTASGWWWISAIIGACGLFSLLGRLSE